MEYTVNYLLAPSNKYVGWVVYNNGYFFGSGNSLSKMIHNIKQSFWKSYGSKVKLSLQLATKPTDKNEVPLNKMTPHFKSLSYFNHKTTGFLTQDQVDTWNRIKPKPVEPVEQAFVCKEKDGYMVVYELKEIAKYKLLKEE